MFASEIYQNRLKHQKYTISHLLGGVWFMHWPDYSDSPLVLAPAEGVRALRAPC